MKSELQINWLREWRTKANYTSEQVDGAFSFSSGTVDRLEELGIISVKSSLLRELAIFYGVPPAEVLEILLDATNKKLVC